MLVAVHSASRSSVNLPQGSNVTSFATLVMSAALSSNISTCAIRQGDENLEWNVWTHPSVQYAALLPSEMGLIRDVWHSVPTNR